ncbi:MAG TPA: NADH-quinone oxidoreductase subunit NuoB [Candidatus Bathyarchaeia archaeon]|nr:NADH-quinone oxidoreductase subunit NuoB [Candidatus Bathyarchaeia archaeon]
MPPVTREQFLHPDGRPGGSDLRDSFFTSKLADALAWARKFAFFQYPFVTACCGMEYMGVTGPRFDTDRFGMTLPRFTPRQSDLLLVVGTITHRQAPILYRVYEQMADPKWVLSFGNCTNSGGPYNNYAVVQGIDTIIPVDIYVPGCPPRPEAVIDGLLKLQERITRERPDRPVEHIHGRFNAAQLASGEAVDEHETGVGRA